MKPKKNFEIKKCVSQGREIGHKSTNDDDTDFNQADFSLALTFFKACLILQVLCTSTEYFTKASAPQMLEIGLLFKIEGKVRESFLDQHAQMTDFSKQFVCELSAPYIYIEFIFCLHVRVHWLINKGVL